MQQSLLTLERTQNPKALIDSAQSLVFKLAQTSDPQLRSNADLKFSSNPNLPSYQIKRFQDQELHENLKILVSQERKLTHQILLHILEIDRRKLYLERAYPSLWEYLVKGVGYSAPQAQRRIDAARLMIQVPQLGEKLELGSLNLSQVSALQKNIRQSKKENKVSFTAEQKQDLVQKLENKTLKQTEAILAQSFNHPTQTQEKKKIQKDHSTRVEMTFSKEEMEMLTWAQGQLAHALMRENSEMNLKKLLLYTVKKVLKTKTGLEV